MKKFSFKLQKLLDLRTFKEKEAEIELGKAIAVRDTITVRLQNIAEREIKARTLFSDDVKTTSDFISHENYLGRLNKEKEEQLTALAEAELVIEEKRAAYIKAHQEKMVLTHLREKKEAVWKSDQNKQEEAAIEDILNTREYQQSV